MQEAVSCWLCSRHAIDDSLQYNALQPERADLLFDTLHVNTCTHPDIVWLLQVQATSMLLVTVMPPDVYS